MNGRQWSRWRPSSVHSTLCSPRQGFWGEFIFPCAPFFFPLFLLNNLFDPILTASLRLIPGRCLMWRAINYAPRCQGVSSGKHSTLQYRKGWNTNFTTEGQPRAPGNGCSALFAVPVVQFMRSKSNAPKNKSATTNVKTVPGRRLLNDALVLQCGQRNLQAPSHGPLCYSTSPTGMQFS